MGTAHKKFGFRRKLWWALALVLLSPVVFTGLYRYIPPPVTPLMIIRMAEGHGLKQRWVGLSQLPAGVPRVFIAAEDANFCTHQGFDWAAIHKAYQDWQRHGRLRGASTISQQTAKNLFLWPSSDPLRKALEIPLTMLIEGLLPKRRILEIYLNVAEFAPGVYGIEAASKHHFNTRSKHLTTRQAALLAAILPSPRKWSAKHAGPYVRQRAGLIAHRAGRLPPLTCLK